MDEQLASLCAEFDVPDGQTLGLNDVGWLKVFRDPTVREQLERAGFVVVEAARIKALSSREPRLMAKHDFRGAALVLPGTRLIHRAGAPRCVLDWPLRCL